MSEQQKITVALPAYEKIRLKRVLLKKNKSSDAALELQAALKEHKKLCKLTLIQGGKHD